MSHNENLDYELLRSILKPLETADLTLEHRYQLRNLIDFQRRFTTLEMKYAHIYSQATALSKKISDYKHMI